KTVLYTGDFSGHGRRGAYLDRFLGEAGKEPDLLLIEGTTLGREGESESTEEELEAQFIQIVAKQETENIDGIVLCQPTSQSIDRIISFYRAAKACGRIFLMDIYTANLMYELEKVRINSAGFPGLARLGDTWGGSLPVPSIFRPGIRVFCPLLLKKKMDQLLGKTYTKRFRTNRITGRAIKRKQKQLVMLIRPSTLTDLKLIGLKEGTLIYSQWQAYREKPNQRRLEAYLKSRGFSDCYLHTSGHAFEEEIKKVIKGLSPKEIVPIHTFRPEAFYQFHPKVTLRQDGVPFEI
ncbi:MAG: MBL fold metallo-hydrolase RNA specificity domain-containing protein, partial [Eubacteriales bacterium]|nr:MBL fold metallo-hydrolase RNA specificity domain-containing protein [Eubacteriales bacterium]